MLSITDRVLDLGSLNMHSLNSILCLTQSLNKNIDCEHFFFIVVVQYY